MIYDCFTFFNELDLLEIRLNILDDVVDKFVLVEGTKTFSNNNKPLYFQENEERFKKFENKIIHIIVDDFPPFESAWDYEFYQRNAIVRGLKQCKEDDVILISDIDEIPNPEKIIKYKDYVGIKVFKQKMFYYYLNNINIRNPFWFDLSTKMIFYSDFLKNDSSAQKIRFLKGKILNNGGWHFSYLGGAEAIVLKIKSFAHQEFNIDRYTDIDSVKKSIEKGEDLYNQKKRKTYAGIEIDKNFPEFIVKNKSKYTRLIIDENINCLDKIILNINRIKQSVILFLKQVKYKFLIIYNK